MLTKLAIIDLETTGLDPERHEIWDFAVILTDTEHLFKTETTQFFVGLEKMENSDLIAINIGGFFDRYFDAPRDTETPDNGVLITNRNWLALWCFTHLQGCHIVGAVPDFDTRFLTKLLSDHKLIPTWHYHLICVENLVAGMYGLQPPWKSDALYEKLGLKRDTYEKHTALGDAKLALDVYRKVMLRDK